MSNGLTELVNSNPDLLLAQIRLIKDSRNEGKGPLHPCQ